MIIPDSETKRLPPIETWQALLRPEAHPLLEAVSDLSVSTPAAMTRLRAKWDPDLIRAAIELMRARRKAARKLSDADRWVADAEGVEQATSTVVARHKAERFERDSGGQIADLCSGIGGDARELARIREVIAYDRSPLRAWMTRVNANCECHSRDVTELSLAADTFHLDPSRRSGGKRAWRYRDYQPGPEFIERLLVAHPHGAVKLGPGVRFEDLPLEGERELEIISVAGSLVQAVLWCGRLAHHPGLRTATMIPGSSISGSPGAPPAEADSSVGRYLLLADPALERGQLLGPFCEKHALRELHPGLGILTADHAPDSEWVTPFEVADTLPWRLPRIRKWLETRNAGVREVKSRGRAVDPEQARATLPRTGDELYTIFGLRFEKRVTAVITRRVS